MADSWFYTHEGKTYGPAPTAALCLMAATGKLAATDLIWAEEAPLHTAVPAQTIIPFPPSASPPDSVPDWLGDVRAAEQSRPLSAAPVQPNWLEDVRQTEEPVGFSTTPPTKVKPQPPPLPKSGQVPPTVHPARTPVPKQAEQAPAVSAPVATGVAVPPARPMSGPSLSPRANPVLASPGQSRLEIGSATSPGMVRDCNEDSLLVLQASWTNRDQRHEMAVVVVADGMGGHLAGDRASGLVVRAMGNALAPLLLEAVTGSLAARADVLPTGIDSAFAQANRTVSEAAKADAGCQGMGATAVALVIRDEVAHIGLVGDCRVYHQRGNQLTQVTRDQTLVNRMVELGQLTPEEAANHPRRNEVTQAVGLHGTVHPVRYELKLARSDWMVVACDGLYAHVEDRPLQEAIGQWTGSPAALAHHLVNMANQGGGSDNCTVVVVRCN